MIRQVRIQGFKCLRDVSVELGPLNVLIGPNDSGKSSFLQALSVPKGIGQKSFHYPDKGSLSFAADSVRAEMDFLRGNPRWLSYESPGGSGKGMTEELAQLFTTIGPVTFDPAEIAQASSRGSGDIPQILDNRGRGVAAHLARLALGDRERYETIQSAFRSVTNGRVKEIVVRESGNSEYLLYFRLYDDTLIPASETSQGLLMYLGYLCLLHREHAPYALLIEEPENGLHPLRLHELIQLLRSLNERGVQIVLTTHSPDLLSACKPEEVLVFRRPHPDSGTEIHRLPANFDRISMRQTLGEVWASRGEEGLLDLLPEVEPAVRASAG